PPRAGDAPDAKRAGRPARRPRDHAGHAGRPRTCEHRRGKAGGSRPGLARVPEEIAGAMDCCTRRSFMKSGAMALLGLGSVSRFLIRTAYAEGRAARPKILIAIFQRGAVDGLSMVVPHGDRDYYSSRGSIAVSRPASGSAEATIDLDGFFGLHPAMHSLKPLGDDRHLTIVHA